MPATVRLARHAKQGLPPECGKRGRRASFLYRVPSRLTRCSGSDLNCLRADLVPARY